MVGLSCALDSAYFLEDGECIWSVLSHTLAGRNIICIALLVFLKLWLALTHNTSQRRPPHCLVPVQMQLPHVCQSVPSPRGCFGTVPGESWGLAPNNLKSAAELGAAAAAAPMNTNNVIRSLALRDVAWIPPYREWMSTSQDPQSERTQVDYL